MKKSKNYFGNRRSRKRLPKKEYEKKAACQQNSDSSSSSDDEECEFDISWLLTKPWHNRYDRCGQWKYKGIKITLHSFQCDEHCPNPPDHLIVRSGVDMDWEHLSSKNYQLLSELVKKSDIEYLERTKSEIDPKNKPLDYDENKGYCSEYTPAENYRIDGMQSDKWVIVQEKRLSDPEADFCGQIKWSQVIFCCHECLRGTVSGSFCPGGRLNNHYVRKKDSDQWVHFNDSLWFTHLHKDTDKYQEYHHLLEDLPVEFRLTSKNYRRVLRSKSNLLICKRNFSFWCLPCKSHRLTGFCTLCESVAGLHDSDCLSFQGDDKECTKCHHDRSVHYFDPIWDQAYLLDKQK